MKDKYLGLSGSIDPICFHEIVDYSSDAIYVININTYEIIYANKTLVNVLNNTQCLNKKCHKLLRNSDKPCTDCILLEEEGVAQDVVFNSVNRLFSVRAHCDEWEGVRVNVVFATDVTVARKHSKQLSERAANAQFLDMLVNNVAGGIFRSSMNSLFTVEFANHTYYELNGYTKEQFDEEVGSDASRIIFEEDKKIIQNQIKEYLEGKINDLIFEYRVVKRDKSIGYQRTSAAIKSDENGNCIMVGMIVEDTKRKMAENALRRSKQRYKLAIESTGINVWEYDFKSRKVIQSSSANKIHGYSRIMENVPESMIECGYILEDEAEKFRNLFKRMEAGEAKVSGEFLVRSEIRAESWYERITYSAIYDEGGKALCAYGASQDITQLKQLEKRYNEELQYRENMGEAVIATCSINLTQGVVESMRVGSQNDLKEKYKNAIKFSDRAAEFLYSYELTEEQNNELGVDYLTALYKKGIYSSNQEYLAQREPGKFLWMRTDVNLLKRPDTEDIVAFFYNRDVTEEKTIKTILDKVVGNDYDLICRIDINRNNIVAFANGKDTVKSSSKLKDFTKSIQAVLPYVYGEENAKKFEGVFQIKNLVQELETKPVFVYEMDMYEMDGRIRRKQIRISYMDKRAGFLIMTRSDIDDIVKKEQAKQEMLEKALKAAEIANNSKSDFMARMSHDMRTPMNAIIGMTALGIDEIKDEQAKFYFENINISANLLMGLVDNVLEMSKLDGDSISMNLMPYKIKDFIKHINIAVRPQCAAKNISFIARIEGLDGLSLMIDKTGFNKIFFNLINNAIKFTPCDGSIELNARCIEKKSESVVLRISVHDTGIGMSQDFQNQMFEPFTQEITGINNSNSGSGLGLAVAKKMVDLMNGSIKVSSKQNEGSEFIVEIEAKIYQTDQIKAQENSYYIYEKLKGKRVLLCEDNNVNKQIFIKLLEKQGIIVEHAENGKVGLEMFKLAEQGYYDAILMDIRMPVMDGLSASEMIRKESQLDAKTIPILAITANAYDEDIQKSKNAGMNAHIAKPIDPHILYQTLYGCIAGKTGGYDI